MTDNPHFAAARNWKAACAMLAFRPLAPAYTAGLRLESLRIYVRDHRRRELAFSERTLEACYGGFVLSQAQKGAAEARRLALDVSYGRDPRDIQIGGHPGRVFELGPEPEPGDIDGRSPAVVAWHDGEMFCLVASDQMPAGELVRIANSLYV